MNIGLLLPAGLIALLALAVPLLLHLVRQTEQKRIEFAALRWLVSRAQPRRRPRFNEWLLLTLRLLLLALLALWLAQPVLNGHPDLRPWVVVDPAIDATKLATQLTLQTSNDEQRHWLAPGFPALDQPPPPRSASIASLLRELDASLPPDVAITAFVPKQFDATDAQRPLLSRAVNWKPVPGISSFDAAGATKPMRIAVFADAGHQRALPYLRAAAVAWSSEAKAPTRADTLREIATINALDAEDTHLFWLASNAVPAQQQQRVRDGGTILLAQDSAAMTLEWQDAQVAWRARDGTPLALRLSEGKGAWIRMLVPLTPQSLPTLLDPGFPRALQDLLASAPPVATRARADSYAPVVDENATAVQQSPRPLGGLLALLIALLFGIERWLAMSTRRFRPE